jgi:hypothetical protein
LIFFPEQGTEKLQVENSERKQNKHPVCPLLPNRKPTNHLLLAGNLKQIKMISYIQLKTLHIGLKEVLIPIHRKSQN